MDISCATFIGWDCGANPALAARLGEAVVAAGFQSLFRHGSFSVHGAGRDHWLSRQHLARDDRFTLIVGEPLARTDTGLQARPDWLDGLHAQQPDALRAQLGNTHGTFCGLTYEQGQWALFTDRLGVRGLYWADLGESFVFSSSRWLIEQVLKAAGAPLTKDHVGIAEFSTFNFALADRTTHREIRRLRDSETLQFLGQGRPSVARYADWSPASAEPTPLDLAARRICNAFNLAVSDRLAAAGHDATPCCLLSGGMDSRYILAALMQHTATPPITLNVAPEGSEDCIFGNHAAARMGSRHFHLPATGNLIHALASGISAIQQQCPPGAARLWWSGDGGSVGLGHAYLSRQTSLDAPAEPEDLARRLAAANKWGLSGTVYSRNWKSLAAAPAQGIAKEIARVSHFPQDKRAFAFLLFNDQQRHMSAHFNAAHIRDFDFVLPFFDPRFIQAVLAAPTEYLLNHRLYNFIFENLLPASVRCAWQVYPGHQACPYPPPDGHGGRNQWADGWSDPAGQSAQLRESARQLLQTALRADLPPQLARGPVMAIAAYVWAGATSRSYLIDQVNRMLNAYEAPANRR